MVSVTQSAIDSTSLRRPCDNDDRPAMHTISQGGTTRYVCCTCYVVAGNPPADWHPACMAAHDAHPYTVRYYPEGKRYTVIDRLFATEQEAEAQADMLRIKGKTAFTIARRTPEED